MIIAGVSIGTLTGSEGLFSKAKTAAEKYNEAAKHENELLSKILNGDWGQIPTVNNGNTDNNVNNDNNGEDNTVETSNYISSVALATNVKYRSVNITATPTGSDTSKIIAYHYFAINKNDENDIYAKASTTNNMRLYGLKLNAEYYVVAKAYDITGANVTSEIKTINTTEVIPTADLYVSATADATTANGTKDHPYSTIQDAINNATTGNSIYVMPGYYVLSGTAYGAGTLAIGAEGKSVTIFGSNEYTILYFDASSVTTRDAAIVGRSSTNTPNITLRNLTIIYKPKISTTNYNVSIFRENQGTAENVFFRIIGNYSASYCYDNDRRALNIKNCTFFHDTERILGDYTGNPTYANIATNVAPTNGTRTNVKIGDFNGSDASTEILDLIENSRINGAFNKASAGVFYGDNAW